MDQKLMSILACPVCKGPLKHDRTAAELLCFSDGLAFPVRDDIPVMLEEDARKLSDEEKEKH